MAKPSAAPVALTAVVLLLLAMTSSSLGRVWESAIISGFRGNNANVQQGIQAKPQANLAEFTLGLNNMDKYDLSNVNAYNLPLMINPTFTNGGVRRGLHWGSPRFYIPFLDSFCKPPNRHTGPPGKGCINVVGPTTPRPTPSKAFKRACPSSYSYTLDDRNANPGVMYGCNVGSNYEVDFCP
uniref:Thaumatin-like protein n=1 Tax=Physcomitrium patens TaxID=3218 RepID=A0A7I4ECR3_PHYPA